MLRIVPSCGRCKWWRKTLSPNGPLSLDWGECKARPPLFANKPRLRDLVNKQQGVWPETSSSDWCGAFQPTEEVLRSYSKFGEIEEWQIR